MTRTQNLRSAVDPRRQCPRRLRGTRWTSAGTARPRALPPRRPDASCQMPGTSTCHPGAPDVDRAAEPGRGERTGGRRGPGRESRSAPRPAASPAAGSPPPPPPPPPPGRRPHLLGSSREREAASGASLRMTASARGGSGESPQPVPGGSAPSRAGSHAAGPGRAASPPASRVRSRGGAGPGRGAGLGLWAWFGRGAGPESSGSGSECKGLGSPPVLRCKGQKGKCCPRRNQPGLRLGHHRY